MTKIYLVVSGEYSDFHVDGAFSSRENAEAIIGTIAAPGYTEYRIEEYDLDTGIENARQGMKQYLCRITRSRNVEVDLRDNFYNLYGDSGFFDFPNNYCEYVWAHDEQHAAKIVNEKVNVILANDIWKATSKEGNAALDAFVGR